MLAQNETTCHDKRMPADPPAKADLSMHRTGWLLSRLKGIRPDRELAGKLIRELASEEREDRMSLNEIAEKAKIPRSTVHRWAKDAEGEPES